MWMYVVLLAVCSLTAVAATAGPICDDVDAEACRLMQVQQANLCQNTAVATSLCKRFCNLCPIECYHCDVTVQDYHMCNTTKLCDQGEVCMKKELKSFIDGHHEYEFTCVDKHICDGGNDLVIPFGKRMASTRDISVTCCTNDLCNYPHSIQTTTTTTTMATTTTPFKGCPKDIIFVVDQSAFHTRYALTSLVDLLRGIFGQIDIGIHDNQVAYYAIEHHGKKLIDLDDNEDKDQLLMNLEHRIINEHPHNSPDPSFDLQNTIRDVAHRTIAGNNGDRRSFDDTVVLIAFDSTLHNFDPTHLRSNETLQHVSNNVITLMVGPTSSSTMAKANDISTDSQHVLTVGDERNIASIADRLVRMIQKC